MVKYLLLTLFFLGLCIRLSPGSNVYSDKRGRPQYSSLIPFPRVGRSGSGVMRPGPDSGSGVWYYGQKRGGKSGLIPFPRVGRSGPGTWDLGDQYQRVEARSSPFSRRLIRSSGWSKSDPFKRRITRSGGWDFTRRIMRSVDGGEDGFKRRITRSGAEVTPAPSHSLYKRQSLIPFPRTGKRSSNEQNQIYVYENEEDNNYDGLEAASDNYMDDEYSY